MTHPVTAGETAWASVRARFVVLAAASRSRSSTTAITYACRVGTSIWESRWRIQSRPMAIAAVGAAAIATRTTFETRGETTLVGRRPKRLASGTAGPRGLRARARAT